MAKRAGPRDKAKARKARDVALIVGQEEDGQGYQVLRQRGEESEIEMGVIRPLKEGKPIDGEVVSLRQRRGMPFVYDVKTQLPDPRPSEEHRLTSDGPAQVATEDYRRGWEAIWGVKGARASRPN